MKAKLIKDWFDNEQFWRDFYPYMFSVKRFSEAPKLANQLIRLTKPKGKNVLDLCCGPGRFSIALAKRRYKVTGVDKTMFLLNKAKAMARVARQKIDWVHSDMRDFVRPDSFDLAINMFTSFGFFDKKDDDLRVLKNIFTSLRCGGVCCIDVMGKEYLAKIFVNSAVDFEPDGAMIIRKHEVFENWTKTKNEWILVKNGKTKKYTIYLNVYSGQELKDRMESVGFVNIKLYGSLDGESYGLKSRRLIAIAKKP